MVGFKQFIKDKKLQKLGNSLVLIIPKTWIKELRWTQNTNLKMSLNPSERKIIITEAEAEKAEESNEEVSELIKV